MKRLIVLLIVVAGGLAAAAFAVPTNAATVNGVAISQDQLNSDLAAIADSSNDLYGCYLSAAEAVGTGGETAGPPPVDSVGQVTAGGAHSSANTAFAASYLDTAIGHQLLLQVAAARHVVVTPAEVSAARAQLVAQITEIMGEVSGTKFKCGSSTQPPSGTDVLATMPKSFVNQLVQFNATETVLEDDFSGYGASVAGQERYFDAHRASFDTVCYTVAEYSTQSDATTAAASVASGTPFAQVVAAAGGGPEQCAILYGITTELPAGSDVGNLKVNTVSQPIAYNGAYLLLEFSSKSISSFAAAKSDVGFAEQNAGTSATGAAFTAAEKRAAIGVDPRYGRWVPAVDEILQPAAPVSGDVLNAAADNPPSAAPAASGQTP